MSIIIVVLLVIAVVVIGLGMVMIKAKNFAKDWDEHYARVSGKSRK